MIESASQPATQINGPHLVWYRDGGVLADYEGSIAENAYDAHVWVGRESDLPDERKSILYFVIDGAGGNNVIDKIYYGSQLLYGDVPGARYISGELLTADEAGTAKFATDYTVEHNYPPESIQYGSYGRFLSSLYSIGGIGRTSNNLYLTQPPSGSILRLKVRGARNSTCDFHYLHYLRSLDLKGASFPTATSLSRMCQNCSHLTDFDGRGFQYGKVTDVSYMFDGCGRLTDFSTAAFWTFPEVTNADYMFQNSGIAHTEDLGNWVFPKATDAGYFFANCKNLSAVNLNSNAFPKVTHANHFVMGCPKLSQEVNVYFPKAQILNGFYNASGILGIYSCSFPEGLEMDSFCAYCSSLSRFGVNAYGNRGSVYTPKATTFNGFFQGCSQLKTVNPSSWVWTSVTSARDMFKGCSALENVLGITDIGCDLSFADSPLLSATSVGNILTALRTLSGGTTCTLTLHPDVFALLTEEQIAGASAKGWSVVAAA